MEDSLRAGDQMLGNRLVRTKKIYSHHFLAYHILYIIAEAFSCN